MSTTQRILYITDTHLGAHNDKGYFLQPRYLDHWPALLDSLRSFIKSACVDTVIHGGDLIETANSTLIESAANDMRSLGVPFYLALGNHDLDTPEAINHWLTIAPDLFPQQTHTGAVSGKLAHIFLLSHHYASTNPPHFWDTSRPDAQTPIISPTQKATLELFTHNSGKPIILITHCPVNAVPASQTGKDIFHPPNQPYTDYLTNLAATTGKIPLILSAHNHANAVNSTPHYTTTTSASFTESPCSAKLITIGSDQISIQQINFAQYLDTPLRHRPTNSWAAGLESDMQITIPLHHPPQQQQPSSSAPHLF